MHDEPLRLPEPPSIPTPAGLPVLAMIAPVIGAVVMWVVLDSIIALAFAALGPVIALASLGDAKFAGAKHRRNQRARFTAALGRLDAQIDRALDRVATELRGAHPGPRHLATLPVNDATRWHHRAGAPIDVVLGRGTRPSGLRIDPFSIAVDPDTESLAALRRSRCAHVHDVPVVVDAREGIGVVADALVGPALVRSIALQVCARLDPRQVRLVVSGPDPAFWAWCEALPCEVVTEVASVAQLRVLADGDDVTIAWDPVPTMLPRECRLVIVATAAVARLGSEEFTPELLSQIEARDAALRLRDAARFAGIRVAGSIPDAVAWDDMDHTPFGVLGARFAVGDEDLEIDLVRDGPHAIVGGTTGSGKSELLIAWVASLAAAHPPERCSVLLVDFKGGASFRQLERLPHCVGTVTDLDAHGALRALTSLRAELQHRERTLLEYGATSIDDAPDLMPRLVIVVDEFQAMLHEHPDLHRVFVDLAARGRSLGVHLILCTQRPADAARDSLLANCGLRLCLRVTSASESIAVTDVADAAHFPLEHRGRVVVHVAGRDTVHAQSALASRASLDALAASLAHAPRPRRPWVDPPGPRVTLADVRERVALLPDDAVGVPFALVDRPALQRVDALCARAQRDGNVLVLGGSASGKSTLLATLASAGTAIVRDVESLDDVLRRPAVPGTLLIDDVDLLLARVGDEHQLAIADALQRRLRESGVTGSTVWMTARRIAGPLSPVASLADTRVLLRMPNRHEHVLAGGASDEHLDDAPAGAGWLRGERIQIALPDEAPREVLASRPAFRPGPRGVAVVSREDRVGSAIATALGVAPARAGNAGPDDRVILGTPPEWEAAWGALESARARMPILFAEPDPRDMRQLLRGTPLPPAIGSPGAAWLVDGHAVTRVALPTVPVDDR